MPGRAYLSRIPSWESNLSFLKPDQFARVGGAKIYGVNTSLCSKFVSLSPYVSHLQGDWKVSS